MPFLYIRWQSVCITCLILTATAASTAQTTRPAAPSQSTARHPSEASSTSFPSSLGFAETVEAALQGAESAVAQVVVALAQVRAPVAMLKAKSSNPADAEALLEDVERLADTTMNAYQRAVIATADDVIIASSTATQAVAMLAQIRVNLTVAVTQLTVMQEAQAREGGPDELSMAQATAAKQQAVMQAASAQQQVDAALQAARDIELFTDANERRQAFQIVVEAKRAVQVHAMVTGAYVLAILAHAANQESAIQAANEAVNEALVLHHALAGGTREDQSRPHEEIQVAMVRARLARAVTRIAIANSDVTGVTAPELALEAAEVVRRRVSEVLSAASRAAAAPEPQTAQMIAVIARSNALTASIAARIADAYIRLAIAQATEGTSNPALTARIAAADQLQNAVSLAQEAEGEADLTTAAETIGTRQDAALRTESRVSLGAAWAQSATSWAYAAWAWSLGLTEVAEAAEAAAIATESAATMVEANVGAVATNTPASPDLPMHISSLALTTLSPSSVAAEVAAKEAAKEAAETAEAETPPQSPTHLPVGGLATNPDDNTLLADTLRPSATGVASPSR